MFSCKCDNCNQLIRLQPILKCYLKHNIHPKCAISFFNEYRCKYCNSACNIGYNYCTSCGAYIKGNSGKNRSYRKKMDVVGICPICSLRLDE